MNRLCLLEREWANVRQRAETRALKRASVTGRLLQFAGDFRLVVQNAGPATAKAVGLTLDGRPAVEHDVWLGGQSDTIEVLGAGAEVAYLLAVVQQSPDKVLFEVTWENPSGERDSWSTELKLL